MVNIEILTRECTMNANFEVIEIIIKIIDNYGKVFLSKKCYQEDIDKLHLNLLDLNEVSNEMIYIPGENKSDIINDAESIYFNSDDIWVRDKVGDLSL